MPPHTSLLPQLGGLHATRPCVCPRINRLGDIPYPAHTPCPHDACAARPDTPACCYTAHSPPRATQISLRTHNMAKISVTAGRVLFFLASSPTVTATAFHTPALLAPSISPLVLGLQSCPPGNPEPPQVPQGANTGPPGRFSPASCSLFTPSAVTACYRRQHVAGHVCRIKTAGSRWINGTRTVFGVDSWGVGGHMQRALCSVQRPSPRGALLYSCMTTVEPIICLKK